DFGIAKAATGTTETRAGDLKGKTAYMSPEQCRGSAVDRRSDVFALGILLYELATGTRLYQGETEFAIMDQIVNHDAPSPSSRCRGFPPELEAIIERALRRDPDQRFATAQAIQVALQKFGREQKLDLSSVALAQYMQTLFGEDAADWR